MLIEPITTRQRGGGIATRDEMIDMTAMTTAEVASAFDTTPRNLRKFLRSDAKANDAADTLPGKGSRYSLDGSKRSLNSLKKRFDAWQVAEAKARAERAAKAVAEAEQAVGDDPEVEGPTDEEIAEIEA